MIDLIVFSVGSNRYALNIENIQRIIQAVELTDIPNSHELIDGMMSHEDGVIKVLNFRKLIGLATYDDELKKLFLELKVAHNDWISELKESVYNSSKFSKTTNPHKCELGVWLDNFNSYDENVSNILKNLIENHKRLHTMGAEVLSMCENDREKAKTLFNTEVNDIFMNTMKDIDSFIAEFKMVTNSLQKLVLYENNGSSFAIKVDSIEDIAHIEDTMIMNSDEDHNISEFLELQGVLDLDSVLINVIKTVKIPS